MFELKGRLFFAPIRGATYSGAQGCTERPTVLVSTFLYKGNQRFTKGNELRGHTLQQYVSPIDFEAKLYWQVVYYVTGMPHIIL